MLPSTISDAFVAARQSDLRKRAEQARYVELARAQAAQHASKYGRPVVAPAHRRLRWWRRPVIRPA